MQTQSPDKNNPSNPLYKVAALTLDKEHVGMPDSRATVRILATLTFKRSSDLRGKTKASTGHDVTVCFSLEIRRASFELTASFDRAGGASNVELKKVAHIAPLARLHKVRDTRLLEQTAVANRSLEGSAAAGMRSIEFSANAGLKGKLASGSKSRTSSSQRASTTSTRNNITATAGRNIVHWEILPNSEAFASSASSNLTEWLEGDVFRTSTGRVLDACIASWRREESRGPPTITGAVFTSMSDLIVKDIRLLTEIGDEVSIGKVEQGAKPTSFGFLFMSDPKERLVKQIIRKHLISQGLNAEGARVEICKASV